MYQLGMVAGFLKIRHADAVLSCSRQDFGSELTVDGGAFDLM
jgi:hypothetical protein